MSEKTKMWVLLVVGCVSFLVGAVIFAWSDAAWTAAGVLGFALGFVCILLAEIVYDDTRAFYTKSMRVWLFVGFGLEIAGLIGLGLGRLLGLGFSGAHLAIFIVIGIVLFAGIIISTVIQVRAENIHRNQNAIYEARAVEAMAKAELAVRAEARAKLEAENK